jgi:hypothetical protein
MGATDNLQVKALTNMATLKVGTLYIKIIRTEIVHVMNKDNIYRIFCSVSNEITQASALP